MFYSAAVVILLVLISSTYSSPIMNGEDVGQMTVGPGKKFKIVGQEKFPFMVHLEINGVRKEMPDGIIQGVCGGVIISENAVLTAGHCLSGYMHIPLVIIEAGIVHLEIERGRGQFRKMKDYVIHDGYLEESFHTEQMIIAGLSDIAIVFLDLPFKFGPTVQSAILSDLENGPPGGQEGLVLGWGNQNNFMLQKTRMRTLSYLDCQKLFKNLVVQDDTFCAIADSKMSGPSCGDSGGPFLMDDGKVYGIGSYRCFGIIGQPDYSKPSIYTSTGDYYEWIQEELEKYNSSVLRKETKRRNTEDQQSSSSGKKAKDS